MSAGFLEEKRFADLGDHNSSEGVCYTGVDANQVKLDSGRCKTVHTKVHILEVPE